MTEFLEKLDALRETLFAQAEVQQYFALKHAIESDAELMAANAKMRFHQKEMAKQMHNAQKYASEKALFEHYSAVYNQHPLVVNYEATKAIVYALLNQVKNILEK